MGESPVYEMERMLKNTLFTTEAQLRQPRNDLRFLLRSAGTVHLSDMLQPTKVEVILQGLEELKKGPDRIYALTLLLRKVMVFLFAQQSKSTNAVINPSQHPSWRILDQYSHRFGKKRKLHQRDRAVFGRDVSEPMTQDEMTILLRGCLSEMDRLEELYDGRFLRGEAERWQKCFATVLFVVLIAQRSQTIAALSTETILEPGAAGNESTTQYLVRISASENKAGQPVLLHIPELLTPRMHVLFARVLFEGHKGPIFVMRNGRGRTDFTEMTRPMTTLFLGRGINPHAFRHAMTTSMYERPDVDEALLRGLADVMTHTSEVQKKFYVRQKRLKTSAALQAMVMEGLGKEMTEKVARSVEEGGKEDDNVRSVLIADE